MENEKKCSLQIYKNNNLVNTFIKQDDAQIYKCLAYCFKNLNEKTRAFNILKVSCSTSYYEKKIFTLLFNEFNDGTIYKHVYTFENVNI